MIPFSELQRLADKCQTKIGAACKVSVSYWRYKSGNSDLSYNLYMANDTTGTRKFATIQEFKAAVANILNPPKDTGVKISTKKEVNDVNNSQ